MRAKKHIKITSMQSMRLMKKLILRLKKLVYNNKLLNLAAELMQLRRIRF